MCSVSLIFFITFCNVSSIAYLESHVTKLCHCYHLSQLIIMLTCLALYSSSIGTISHHVYILRTPYLFVTLYSNISISWSLSNKTLFATCNNVFLWCKLPKTGSRMIECSLSPRHLTQNSTIAIINSQLNYCASAGV